MLFSESCEDVKTIVVFFFSLRNYGEADEKRKRGFHSHHPSGSAQISNWRQVLQTTLQYLLDKLQMFPTFFFFFFPAVLEGKVRTGERKAEALARDKARMETELESMTRKSHDASGQLLSIGQELLKKEG